MDYRGEGRAEREEEDRKGGERRASGNRMAEMGEGQRGRTRKEIY